MTLDWEYLSNGAHDVL